MGKHIDLKLEPKGQPDIKKPIQGHEPRKKIKREINKKPHDEIEIYLRRKDRGLDGLEPEPPLETVVLDELDVCGRLFHYEATHEKGVPTGSFQQIKVDDIDTRTTVVKGDGVHVKIKGKNKGQLLNKRYIQPSEKKENQDAGVTAAQLTDVYVPELDTSEVEPVGVDLASVEFEYESVSEALNKLAIMADCLWYVDDYDKLYFIKKGSRVNPYRISTSKDLPSNSPNSKLENGVQVPNVVQGTFEWAKDKSTVVNKIYAFGATELASHIENYISDGVQDEYHFSHQPNCSIEVEIDYATGGAGSHWEDVLLGTYNNCRKRINERETALGNPPSYPANGGLTSADSISVALIQDIQTKAAALWDSYWRREDNDYRRETFAQYCTFCFGAANFTTPTAGNMFNKSLADELVSYLKNMRWRGTEYHDTGVPHGELNVICPSDSPAAEPTLDEAMAAGLAVGKGYVGGGTTAGLRFNHIPLIDGYIMNNFRQTALEWQKFDHTNFPIKRYRFWVRPNTYFAIANRRMMIRFDICDKADVEDTMDAGDVDAFWKATGSYAGKLCATEFGDASDRAFLDVTQAFMDAAPEKFDGSYWVWVKLFKEIDSVPRNWAQDPNEDISVGIQMRAFVWEYDFTEFADGTEIHILTDGAEGWTPGGYNGDLPPIEGKLNCKDRCLKLEEPIPVDTEFEIAYDYEAPACFVLKDQPSINEWETREMVLVDVSGHDKNELIDIAKGILRDFAQPSERGRCEVYNVFDYKEGDAVTLEVPQINLNSKRTTIHKIQREHFTEEAEIGMKGRHDFLYFGLPEMTLDNIISQMEKRMLRMKVFDRYSPNQVEEVLGMPIDPEWEEDELKGNPFMYDEESDELIAESEGLRRGFLGTYTVPIADLIGEDFDPTTRDTDIKLTLELLSYSCPPLGGTSDFTFGLGGIKYTYPGASSVLYFNPSSQIITEANLDWTSADKDYFMTTPNTYYLEFTWDAATRTLDTKWRTGSHTGTLVGQETVSWPGYSSIWKYLDIVVYEGDASYKIKLRDLLVDGVEIKLG